MGEGVAQQMLSPDLKFRRTENQNEKRKQRLHTSGTEAQRDMMSTVLLLEGKLLLTT